MALSINLFHEQLKAERQRQRDPLKLGIYLLASIAALLVGWYFWTFASASRTLSQRDDIQAQWQKKQRDLAAVTAGEDDLKKAGAASAALNARIDARFHWGPVLDLLYRIVPREVQVQNLVGAAPRRAETASFSLEGLCAGTSATEEPRAAAERFRRTLLSAFEKKYQGVSVEFRQAGGLDESGSKVRLDNVELATVRFVMEVKLRKPFAPAPPTPVPTPAARRPR